MNANRAGAAHRALILMLLPALLAGCSRGGDGTSAGEAAAPAASTLVVAAADVIPVESRRIESGISFTGELIPQQVTQVNARFDGDITRVLVREGQAVRRGQPLARFKPRDVEDNVRAAEADQLAARAALAAAENGERRARRLLEAGAAAPSELEAAEAALAAARARLSLADAALNRAREDSEKLDVPAPISGRVSRIVVHDGDRPAIGDPLMTLVNIDTLELSATIPSEALGRVQAGTPIHFRTDAFPGQVFVGRVDRLGPTTESGTRQVRVYTRIPNGDHRLVGGLFASGRIVDAVRESALVAPLAALRGEGAEKVVYRLRNGRAERVVVTTGLVDETDEVVELAGGLAPGDSLLTGVLPGIRDGVTVQVANARGGATTAGAPTPGASAAAGGAAESPGK